jgi:hypothetical protein
VDECYGGVQGAHDSLIAETVVAFETPVPARGGQTHCRDQVKRAGFGYRNMINYQRRIMTHIAVTRPQRSVA